MLCARLARDLVGDAMQPKIPAAWNEPKSTSGFVLADDSGQKIAADNERAPGRGCQMPAGIRKGAVFRSLSLSALHTSDRRWPVD